MSTTVYDDVACFCYYLIFDSFVIIYFTEMGVRSTGSVLGQKPRNDDLTLDHSDGSSEAVRSRQLRSGTTCRLLIELLYCSLFSSIHAKGRFGNFLKLFKF